MILYMRQPGRISGLSQIIPDPTRLAQASFGSSLIYRIPQIH